MYNQCGEIRNVNRQGNMTPSKEHQNSLVASPKVVKTYELPENELKIVTLRNVSEMEENTNR
jgi:hypothetical protein